MTEDDRDCHLMNRRNAGCCTMLVMMEIRSTNPSCLDLDQHFVVPDLWFWDVSDLKVPITLRHLH